MAGDDNDEFAIGVKTAIDHPKAKCNECHYRHANATHRKVSYGYYPKDLPPLEL